MFYTHCACEINCVLYILNVLVHHIRSSVTNSMNILLCQTAARPYSIDYDLKIHSNKVIVRQNTNFDGKFFTKSDSNKNNL